MLKSAGVRPKVITVRTLENKALSRIYRKDLTLSPVVDRTTGVIYDQTIVLTGFYSAKDYPDKLRRVKYHDAKTGKTLIFLTNNFALPSLTIAHLYKCRWQVELFFKWIKQNLRIKSFYGTSANAVKTQIWIAVSVYVLVAIIKKRLNIPVSLYTMLQILSVTAFDRMPLIQLLTEADCSLSQHDMSNQLNLFSYSPDSSDVVYI